MWDISSLSSSAPVTAYFRSTSLTSGWYLRNPIIARNWFKSVRSKFNSLITSPTDLLNSGEIVGGIDPLLNFNFKDFIFSSNWSNVKNSSLTFCNTTLQSSPVKKNNFKFILILDVFKYFFQNWYFYFEANFPFLAIGKYECRLQSLLQSSFVQWVSLLSSYNKSNPQCSRCNLNHFLLKPVVIFIIAFFIFWESDRGNTMNVFEHSKILRFINLPFFQNFLS